MGNFFKLKALKIKGLSIGRRQNGSSNYVPSKIR
jgi:hypothetical protein